ncbi:hypothetical protein LA76x_4568 [Lysobacter antibioticus]|uniref:Uncharacterized protein n=1 Tax=Lysobacter antibioticus TaxID=84531 RepID=A0A0S2FGM1_LYSAN|nr:hypothetical protein LA76x_4568 [Lysobacter antibioticus]
MVAAPRRERLPRCAGSQARPQDEPVTKIDCTSPIAPNLRIASTILKQQRRGNNDANAQVALRARAGQAATHFASDASRPPHYSECSHKTFMRAGL